MPEFTAEQRRELGRRIREGKDRLFPGRGGCGRLADELGVTPQQLSHWMNGSRMPESKHLAALAKRFKVSILELCAFPKLKRTKEPPSALDVIVDVTKARKIAGSSRKAREKLHKNTTEIKSFLEKELNDFSS